MGEAIRTTLDIYRNYEGTGCLLFLVSIAVVYLWMFEEKKEIRTILVYVPFGIIVLFFFPLFSYISMRYFLDDQVYYRLLWLIPMGLLACYGIVKVISRLNVRKKRIMVGTLLGLFLLGSGNLIYANDAVTITKNLYHLPPEDIAVADVMHVDGRDVKAVVPSEMLQFIRQYDASIKLAYGREELIEGWRSNPFYDAMESNPVRTFLITDYAMQQGVEYIVLRSGTPLVGTKPINKYRFSFLTSAYNYDIYIFEDAPFFEEKKQEYRATFDEDVYGNYTYRD